MRSTIFKAIFKINANYMEKLFSRIQDYNLTKIQLRKLALYQIINNKKVKLVQLYNQSSLTEFDETFGARVFQVFEMLFYSTYLSPEGFFGPLFFDSFSGLLSYRL